MYDGGARENDGDDENYADASSRHEDVNDIHITVVSRIKAIKALKDNCQPRDRFYLHSLCPDHADHRAL